jgi:hypothetical protein
VVVVICWKPRRARIGRADRLAVAHGHHRDDAGPEQAAAQPLRSRAEDPSVDLGGAPAAASAGRTPRGSSASIEAVSTAPSRPARTRIETGFPQSENRLTDGDQDHTAGLETG